MFTDAINIQTCHIGHMSPFKWFRSLVTIPSSEVFHCGAKMALTRTAIKRRQQYCIVLYKRKGHASGVRQR